MKMLKKILINHFLQTSKMTDKTFTRLNTRKTYRLRGVKENRTSGVVDSGFAFKLRLANDF